jgi:hypothetical protein
MEDRQMAVAFMVGTDEIRQSRRRTQQIRLIRRLPAKKGL